ncbi:hypothetical protein C8R43DRAFT_1229449 [Mycena crocata]|nr:hypothetical protein C8R43DRAFT_1229449 [Mycena crocata]
MARMQNPPAGHSGVGINIRALVNSVDLNTLAVVTSDGAATEPQYQISEPDKFKAGDVMEGTTVYKGSCHCGAVNICTRASPSQFMWDDSELDWPRNRMQRF